MIFNMAGGGGGNDTIYAALIVYIDTGSTITVTDGVSTFTGTSVNRECLFDKLTPATWTVTATNGVDTATENVVITNSALIDGYPDPLISTVELSYAGNNTVVAYFWGLADSTSFARLDKAMLSGYDADYFSYNSTSTIFTALTDFDVIIHLVGLASANNNNALSTLEINLGPKKTVTFNMYDSPTDSYSTSLSAGDTVRLTGKNMSSADSWGLLGMFVEVQR